MRGINGANVDAFCIGAGEEVADGDERGIEFGEDAEAGAIALQRLTGGFLELAAGCVSALEDLETSIRAATRKLIGAARSRFVGRRDTSAAGRIGIGDLVRGVARLDQPSIYSRGR